MPNISEEKKIGITNLNKQLILIKFNSKNAYVN